MKKLLLIVALCTVAFGSKAQIPTLNNLADSLSYFIGNTEGAYTGSSIRNRTDNSPKYYNDCEDAMTYIFSIPDSADNRIAALKRAIELRTMIGQMQKQGIAMNPDLFINAFKAGLANTDISMDSLRKQVNMTQEMISRAQTQAKARMEAESKAKTAANEAAGNEYVKALKKKDKKILTTASGLSYKVVKKGKGKGLKPKATDKVKVHYTGKLIDGTVFDSSVERGEPAIFTVNQLIPGFTEGLQLMTPGSKYTFYIPASIGYGERGADDKIAPGSTLVFDVELIEILPEEEKESK